ncbi:MAG TPA: ethanolamine ammonia-lyase subunit EutC [Burkholderiaceae bacterium]|nr:ethanolamine ammonia-lyase subunit EutC [Burkholderiaceae bacterium]
MIDVPIVPAADAAWQGLRALTPARIGLPRSGAALATTAVLDLRLAHARARDAVHDALDGEAMARQLQALGLETLCIRSRAADRRTYLMRPDAGRQPDADAAAQLARHRGRYDLAIVVADGLSARAVHAHASALVRDVLPPLRDAGWRVAPAVVVRHGRVAIGDAIAASLGADAVAVLVGERPGLSAADSLGVYLTWRPDARTTDASRNCISNVRPAGLSCAAAALKLVHLLRAMRARGMSGVALKDESEAARPLPDEERA